jgi:hypothetical protein
MAMFARRDLLTGTAAVAAAAQTRNIAPRRPNFVLFLADDVGCQAMNDLNRGVPAKCELTGWRRDVFNLVVILWFTGAIGYGTYLGWQEGLGILSPLMGLLMAFVIGFMFS